MRYHQLRRYKNKGRRAEKHFGKVKVSEKTRSDLFKGLLTYKRAVKKLFKGKLLDLTCDEARWVCLIAY